MDDTGGGISTILGTIVAISQLLKTAGEARQREPAGLRQRRLARAARCDRLICQI
jgi:hypothetical protein